MGSSHDGRLESVTDISGVQWTLIITALIVTRKILIKNLLLYFNSLFSTLLLFSPYQIDIMLTNSAVLNAVYHEFTVMWSAINCV